MTPTRRSPRSSSDSAFIERTLRQSFSPEEIRNELAKFRLLLFQKEPLEFLIQRLGIRPETVDWTLSPEYRDHKWDGDPNPLLSILNHIAQGHWTAVESATGVGKTFLGAAIALWFLECYPYSLVVTTAPKGDQLRLHIWKEIQTLYPQFGRGELHTLELKMQPGSTRWMALGFVAGVAAEEVALSARRAQGFHQPDMLIILEETPGISEAVLTAFENTAVAPHNILLAFGNPDSTFDTLHKFAGRKHVHTVRISAFDHPNVVLNDPNFIPGAQTREGLQRLLEKYGAPDAPMFLSRARGISPEQSKDSLIRWEWCVAAANRSLDAAVLGAPALGVDVANSESGDKAGIARGEGSRLLEVDSFPCPDSNILGNDVFTIMNMWKIHPENVGVDAIGVGAGAVNELKRLHSYIRAIKGNEGIDEAARVRDFRMEEEFFNLRAQMWWQMRLDLQFGDQSGIILPHDEELFADLCTPRKLDNRKGKILIESKEDIRRRLGRSPDKGDAAVIWNWVRSRRSRGAYRFGTIQSTSDRRLN